VEENESSREGKHKVDIKFDDALTKCKAREIESHKIIEEYVQNV